MTPAPLAPRVSIIIPCYNHAHYLGEAITSAVNQSFRDFEIIVVDDGSTDDTVQVVAGFGDAVRLVHQNNRGLAAARNAGILAARGEFVALLDADDSWLPDYLTKLVPLFATGAKIGAVYCGWLYIDSAGKVLPRMNIRVIPPEETYQAMTFMDFLIPSSVVVRRECFAKLGLFDETFRSAQGCEDWDMWIRLLSKYTMVGVPEALVKYRIHGDNMSSNLEQMERAKQVVVAKHFGTDERRTPAHRRAYGGLYQSSALAYLERGQAEKGQGSLRHAFAVLPELAGDVDTFYQLALTGQPVGSRGVFENLDLDSGARRLLETLAAVFGSRADSTELEPYRARAYATAYLALGLLAYGTGELGRSRKYLIGAFRFHPSIVAHPHFLPLFIRACLGRTLITNIKQLRARLASR